MSIVKEINKDPLPFYKRFIKRQLGLGQLVKSQIFNPWHLQDKSRLVGEIMKICPTNDFVAMSHLAIGTEILLEHYNADRKTVVAEAKEIWEKHRLEINKFREKMWDKKGNLFNVWKEAVDSVTPQRITEELIYRGFIFRKLSTRNENGTFIVCTIFGGNGELYYPEEIPEGKEEEVHKKVRIPGATGVCKPIHRK